MNFYSDAWFDNNIQGTADAELESLNPQCLCDGQCSRMLNASEPSEEETESASSDPDDILPQCICPTCGEEGNPDSLSRRCPECSVLGMPLPPDDYMQICTVFTAELATNPSNTEQESASSDPEGRDHVAMTFQWSDSNSERARKAAEFKENVKQLLAERDKAIPLMLERGTTSLRIVNPFTDP